MSSRAFTRRKVPAVRVIRVLLWHSAGIYAISEPLLAALLSSGSKSEIYPEFQCIGSSLQGAESDVTIRRLDVGDLLRGDANSLRADSTLKESADASLFAGAPRP